MKPVSLNSQNLKNTIRDAIIKVFEFEARPLSIQEIYDRIVELDLYEFNTDQRLHVVATRLRRDCVGITLPSSSKVKYFQHLTNNTYWLKGRKIPQGANEKVIEIDSVLNQNLQNEYIDYIEKFKNDVLKKLASLEPWQFEIFCKNFIKAYGFIDCKVTSKTRDGGIDGYGKYKIGMTQLEVAFECKRWNTFEVGFDVVRKFRGSIPTSCVYGIIFTTSTFSRAAKKEAERKELKPIVLMDRIDIINFMIKNEFGVKKVELLEMYINLIDDELVL